MRFDIGTCNGKDACKMYEFLREPRSDGEPAQISEISRETRISVRHVHTLAKRFSEAFEVEDTESGLVRDKFVYALPRRDQP